MKVPICSLEAEIIELVTNEKFMERDLPPRDMLLAFGEISRNLRDGGIIFSI
jgi:hypothetical protein